MRPKGLHEERGWAVGEAVGEVCVTPAGHDSGAGDSQREGEFTGDPGNVAEIEGVG